MRIYAVSEVTVIRLKSNPIQLSITVMGMASTPGWTNIRLSLDGDKDPNDDVLEFELLGDPPTAPVPQVLVPVTVHFVYDGKDAEKIAAVKVNARTNSITSHASEWSDIPQPGGGPQTTLAIGEEGPTTPFVGEEGPTPTTILKFEENPTTFPKFEEDPTTFRIGEEDPQTTLAVGEEDPNTTRLLGEEDPQTTLVRGEEGPHTTWALGEEGPQTDPRIDDPFETLRRAGLTTLAVGEEEGPRGNVTQGGPGPFGGF